MLATTLALVLAMSTPQAAGLLDSTEFLETGSYPFRTGTAVVVDTARNLAFVGAGSGVFIVDVSDPTQPVVLSDRIRCGTMVKDMFLEGTRLYLALFSFSAVPDIPRDVEIWDVSVPAAPLRLGAVDVGQTLTLCVYARDSVLLVGCHHCLLTYDISDPSRPTRIDSLFALGNSDQIRVRDTFAFVSQSGGAAIAVYSVSSFSHPRFLAYWGDACSFPGIQIVGDRLYLASSWGAVGAASGLRVYDISDPLNGQLLGTLDTARSGAYRIAVRDTVAVITYAFRCYNSPQALKTVSVANPAAPRQLSIHGGKCLGVALHDTLAFVAYGGRFEVVSMADPAQPASVGSIPLGLAGTQVLWDRGMAYSIGGNFAVLDAHSSQDVELAGVLDLGGVTYTLAQRDTIALVGLAGDTGGWRIDVVGLGNPHRPRRLSSLPGARVPYGTVLRDTLAFVVSDSSLQVYSLADPGSPVQVGSLDVPTAASRLVLRDTFLYANGVAGMQVFSIADPRAPALIAETSFVANEYAIRDTWLYAQCTNWPWFAVISIAEPTVFRVVTAQANSLGPIVAMSISDTLLVCASGYGDHLTAISTAVPDGPVVLANVPLSDQLNSVALVGDTVYTSLVTRYRLVRTPSGIELEPIGGVEIRPLRVWPSVARSVLNLAGRDEAVLFDASGRRALRLKRGANDVRALVPGVYFVREEPSAVGRKPSAVNVRKVVITE